MKLSGVFQSHGQFCASHPWEVIIGTIVLLTSVVSMSAISNVERMCGWSSNCHSVQVGSFMKYTPKILNINQNLQTYLELILYFKPS